MKITIPELAVIVVIGASGSGKSTFVRKHFKPTEILSSDYFRGLVSDDENDQAATKPAFEIFHFVMAKRLELGKLVVCDATNVQDTSRKPLVEQARRYHCIPVAIVLDMPEKLCHQRNKDRPDRDFGEHVVRNQTRDLKRSLRNLKREGFRHIFILSSPEDVEAVQIERQPLWNNRKHEHGPFDIIGDIHGCCDELLELITELGYKIEERSTYPFGKGYGLSHPEGRKLIFLGDLVDRGPRSPDVLRLVMSATHDGSGNCVPGNHDIKLVRKLMGKDVQMKHGLAETMSQLESETDDFKNTVRDFLDGLVSHYVFDDGRLVVAHAGMKEDYQGRGSGKVREFALFGETTGETDEFGLPVRYNWAEEYRGGAMVVYGHTPVPEPEWLNRTINIDTGCVFGGKLTALRYPEKETISVAARCVYAEPAKPLYPTASTDLSLQQINDDVLDLEDVLGKRFIRTRLRSSVTIQEENSRAALEVMSRFAANPKWLIYLPPTMSPSETTEREGLLEYPEEAFAYFRSQGISEVMCEEKHMGSRAVLIVCRDAESARERFGVIDGTSGICYTRTGRRFTDDTTLEQAIVSRLSAALSKLEFWEKHGTSWVCLDCEILPWSMKAQELLRLQYAAVGRAANESLSAGITLLEQAKGIGLEVASLVDRTRERKDAVEHFVSAYRQYCWPVRSLEDIKVAPFHVLATEGKVHTDRSHTWHMELGTALAQRDEGLIRATTFRQVDLSDTQSMKAATEWWETMTSQGGEGMVIKPLTFIAQSKKGLVQPALKCRGPEYLRIIYGPEYRLVENLKRLRARGLSSKRSLALREFALGIEGLERFVAREPLRRVHECVFGVLALESEPVDPRL